MKPSSEWTSSGAWFAAYFFGDAVEPIAIMIQDSDSDDIYEAAVPKGDYSQLLFVIFAGLWIQHSKRHWQDGRKNITTRNISRRIR